MEPNYKRSASEHNRRNHIEKNRNLFRDICLSQDMGAKTLVKKLSVYETLSDGEVVDRVINGDLPLFELLMRRYNRRLFRYARCILNDDMLAQDAVQEAYINAFRHLHQFRGPGGFASWLMRITSRSASRIGRREAGVRLLNAAVDPDDLTARYSEQPEPLAANAEIIGRIEKAIDHLPEGFRTVFMLRELEGMSIDETASILEIKPATVKTRLHRAKSLLRTRFGARLEELRPMLFDFAGVRCDRIVQQVFIKLKAINEYY